MNEYIEGMANIQSLFIV